MTFEPFRSQSIKKSAYVNSCLFSTSTDNQSPRFRVEVPDVYTIFRRSPYWCTTDVHQHSVFILGSVNFWETFTSNISSLARRTGLELGEMSYLVIFYDKHHNFLAFSIGWFLIYYYYYCVTVKTIYTISKNKMATVEIFFVK